MQERRISFRRQVYDNNKDVQKGNNYREEILGREVRIGQLRMKMNESVNEK